MHPTNLEHIPQPLRQATRWLRWRLAPNQQGKLTKQPDRSTANGALADFNDVAQHGLDSQQGIGFALTNGFHLPTGGRVYSLDLDGCRDPQTGALESWAEDLRRRCANSYTEVTPSGCGIRIWFAVRNPPKTVAKPKVPISAPRAPNVPDSKPVEFQVFGYGVPQYVTVSGDILPGASPEIVTIESLDEIAEAYGLQLRDQDPVPQLARGNGPPPQPVQIKAAVLAEDNGQAMIDGDWRKVITDSDGDPSASAAFYRVCQVVLRAANGHQAEALAFILAETAWGRGVIEDSADPSRYARASWVAGELGRVAEKSGHIANPWEAMGITFDGWQPPERATVPADGLLEHARDFLADATEDAFLVYGVLPSRGLAQFFGDPGCGKTPMALSLAVHVAGGRPTWFGHEIDQHGPVVYMIGEDRAGIRRRLQAELALHELTPELPLHVTKRPGDLSSPGDVRVWLEQIRELEESPKLLVVDTQSRNFGTGNENSSEDMAVFVNHVQLLADALGCLVLLVHHTGHQNKERGRGSMALFGALDACVRVTRRGRLSITATTTKAKNWSAPEPLRGRLHVSQVGLDRKNRPVTAVALLDSDTSAGVSPLQALAQQNADDAQKAEPQSRAEKAEKRLRSVARALATLNGQPASVRKVSDLSGVSRSVTHRILTEHTDVFWSVAVPGGVPESGGGVPEQKAKTGESVYVLTAEGRALAVPELDDFLHG